MTDQISLFPAVSDHIPFPAVSHLQYHTAIFLYNARWLCKAKVCVRAGVVHFHKAGQLVGSRDSRV